jgi:nitroreductase
MSHPLLEAIRSRRVARVLIDRAVERPLLEQILEAGRWAPNAGNRRLHRYVAVQDALTLRLLRMVSPGMFQRPTAAIMICIDGQRVAAQGVARTSKGLLIDVGTAAQTMLLAAHALGLGSGIITSFSQAAARVVLNLPEHLSPELIVALGYSAPVQSLPMRTRTRLTWQSLTDWERFPARSNT